MKSFHGLFPISGPTKKNENRRNCFSYAANEDNYVFLRLMRDIIGTKNLFFLSHAEKGKDDEILIRADKTPNRSGVRLLGLQSVEDGGEPGNADRKYRQTID